MVLKKYLFACEDRPVESVSISIWWKKSIIKTKTREMEMKCPAETKENHCEASMWSASPGSRMDVNIHLNCWSVQAGVKTQRGLIQREMGKG